MPPLLFALCLIIMIIQGGDFMIVNDRDSRRLVIKSNQTFWFIGIFVIFMAVVFTGFFLSLNPFEDLNTFMDYFGIVFCGIWLLTLLAGGVYSVVTNSKTVTLDARGILCRSLVGQDFILWSEVADWGLSYCGQTKGEGNTYELYFSKHPCLTKNDCRKRLKGKMIRTFVMGNDYEEAVNVIIPFGKERTGVEPFVAVDRFHFWG